jgi:acyl carrier protein
MEHQNGNVEAILSAYIRNECLSRNTKVDLAYGTNLFDAGIVDSAGLISFIAFIERTFGLSVPDEDLLPENFVSITAIADYIRAHQQVGHELPEKVSHMGS